LKDNYLVVFLSLMLQFLTSIFVFSFQFLIRFRLWPMLSWICKI
jgi:hypothetical protein